jgi:hypothetical protein
MQHSIQADILWRSLAIFLLIGASAGVAVSLLLIVNPQLMKRINSVANHWVSTRNMERWLDNSISVERAIYHHHRVLGLAVILGSGYFLMYFGWQVDKAVAMKTFSGLLANQVLLEMLLQFLLLLARIAGAMTLVVGLFLLLRPSLLRGVEELANQWVSARRITKVMDVPRDQVERFVDRHTARIGWLLLIGSSYLFFVMFRWLM